MKKVMVIAAFFLISLSTMALAVDCPIPDTGQTKCYDDTEEITCPQPGEDFYGQDAQYPCNPQSYTKLGYGGVELDDAATSWSMVKDNMTGLIWEVKEPSDGTPPEYWDGTPDYNNPHDADNRYTWYDNNPATNGGDPGTPGDGTDTEDFINALNSANFGGYSNWQMPTVKELSFINNRNLGSNVLTINTDYFPNTTSSYYWSSTSLVNNPISAWYVTFNSGNADYSPKRLYGSIRQYAVRAVRGGQCGAVGNFVDNGDETVTDNNTGLMWQQDTGPVNYNWKEALSYCENLTLAGYNDWRLPSANELQSLVDYSRYNPSIDTIFSNTVSSFYWSSTTFVSNTAIAWYVRFDNGRVRNNGGQKIPPPSFDLYFRAVRGGQCGSFDTSTTTTVTSTTTIEGETTTTSIDESSTTTTIDGISTTTISVCPSGAIYGEHSEQTELLRYIRDNILNQTPEGQEIIRLYYQWSPVIVKAMEGDKGFKEEVRGMIDGVLEMIE